MLVLQLDLPLLLGLLGRAQYLCLDLELMVIVGLGVFAQLTYLLPSWFVLFLAAQVVAFWDLLVTFGVVELTGSAINNTESALTKFFNLVPRYQG